MAWSRGLPACRLISGPPTAMPDKSPVPMIYRKLEAEYADGWLTNVMADAFG